MWRYDSHVHAHNILGRQLRLKAYVHNRSSIWKSSEKLSTNLMPRIKATCLCASSARKLHTHTYTCCAVFVTPLQTQRRKRGIQGGRALETHSYLYAWYIHAYTYMHVLACMHSCIHKHIQTSKPDVAGVLDMWRRRQICKRWSTKSAAKLTSSSLPMWVRSCVCSKWTCTTRECSKGTGGDDQCSRWPSGLPAVAHVSAYMCV